MIDVTGRRFAEGNPTDLHATRANQHLPHTTVRQTAIFDESEDVIEDLFQRE